MANNYCQFSEVIECKSKKRADWLVKRLTEEKDFPVCEVNRDGNDVIVYSEEAGDLSVVAEVIGELQTQFHITKPCIGSCCFLCDKPRIGEFGGAAVVVYQGQSVWIDATEMANAMAKRLVKGGVP